MVRRITLIALTLVSMLALSVAASAQQTSEQLIGRISSTTASFKSIVCDITQTRDVKMMDAPVVSKGKMNYLAPGNLRLEYTSPDKVTYVISGQSIRTTADGKTTTADLSSNRKATGMFDFIMTCITGECIADASSFTSEAREQGSEIIVSLVPVKRDLKQMFQSLEITFDSSTCAAKKIVMNEKGGSSTTLVFTGVKTGVPVDKALFE